MNNSEKLPAPATLLKTSKSLAALDSIFCQEWELRYFSHNSKWAEDEEMGSMRDGEGSDYFVIFSSYGCAIKGCYSKSNSSVLADLAASIKNQVPERFSGFITEPAFSIEEASFIIWFDEKIEKWKSANPSSSPDIDGRRYLLNWLKKGPDFYKNWAEKYYEKEVNAGLVSLVFNFQPLDLSSLSKIGVELDEKKLIEDLEEIGYPYSN